MDFNHPSTILNGAWPVLNSSNGLLKKMTEPWQDETQILRAD